MYPVIRMSLEFCKAKRAPMLGLFDEHKTDIRIYPWDLDIFFELNNGRTLTLYDLPRIGLAIRCGIWGMLKDNKATLTVAGVAVRYRKRITLFQKVTMSAQCIGFDDRFIYILQNCYRKGEACGQALLRMAFVKDGMIEPRALLEPVFGSVAETKLPEWVENFIQASNSRPWPPEGSPPTEE